MVCLRAIHPLCIFPGNVPEEASDGQEEGHEVEMRGGEEPGDDGVVFFRETEFGG